MRSPLSALLSAVLAFAASGAVAQEKITYAVLDDPSHAALIWALVNGKVKSDKVVIEPKPVAIPALIQAIATRQYDVVETAVPSVAQAYGRGLQLKIISIALRLHKDGEAADLWVKKDSAIQSPRDLKGKTLAVYGLQATGIQLTRIVLQKKYGLNAALENGDVKFAELPAPAIPGAIAAGRVEAGALIHIQAYGAQKGGDLRSIQAGQRDMVEIFGVAPVTAVNVSYPDKLAARPEAFREFNRLLAESARYMLANRAEVFGAVAQDRKIDPAFFDVYFSRYSEFPIAVAEDDIKAITRLWDLSKELKMLDSAPAIGDVLWEHALRR